MRLKILAVGEPVLRTPSRPLSIEEIVSPRIQSLISYMRDTLRDAPGVGLAAPQVGEALQLAIIEDRPEYHKTLSESELKKRGRTEVPFHVIVNPKIELLGEPKEIFFEGCLSLPGFGGLVARAQEVRVKCLDDRGEPRTIQAAGWYARILQHEIDHLNGALYIDRMDTLTFSTLDNYTRRG